MALALMGVQLEVVTAECTPPYQQRLVSEGEQLAVVQAGKDTAHVEPLHVATLSVQVTKETGKQLEDGMVPVQAMLGNATATI